jgi:hypothetical protein
VGQESYDLVAITRKGQRIAFEIGLSLEKHDFPAQLCLSGIRYLADNLKNKAQYNYNS